MYGTKSADSTLEGRGKAERDTGLVKSARESHRNIQRKWWQPSTAHTQSHFKRLWRTQLPQTHAHTHVYPTLQHILYASCIYGSSLLLYKALPCHLSNLKFSMRYFQFLFPVTLFSTSISLTPCLMRSSFILYIVHYNAVLYAYCATLGALGLDEPTNG